MDKTTLGSSSILGIMYVSFLPMYLRTHIHVCLQTICTFNDKSVSNSPYNHISIVLGSNPHITTDITGKYSYQHSFFHFKLIPLLGQAWDNILPLLPSLRIPTEPCVTALPSRQMDVHQYFHLGSCAMLAFGV